jgi:hypothetical protein
MLTHAHASSSVYTYPCTYIHSSLGPSEHIGVHPPTCKGIHTNHTHIDQIWCCRDKVKYNSNICSYPLLTRGKYIKDSYHLASSTSYPHMTCLHTPPGPGVHIPDHHVPTHVRQPAHLNPSHVKYGAVGK